MKKITRIARVELSNLFYSPIAWLLLIIFLVQCSLSFFDSAQLYLKMQQLMKLYPFAPQSVTNFLLSNQMQGLFPSIVGKLYLYLPLLTMGLISREVSSGSIRLLYSSPVRTSQIILGKFLAMMIYNLLLLAVLAIFAVITIWNVSHADTGMILSGFFAFLLLLGAYAAIGLFMSCLTSYQVVAALSTLAVFATLQYIGKVWQGIDFVRDITYFFSLGARTQDMFDGMISSKDVLYFIIIIILFLSFSIMRLQADQEHRSGWMTALRYTGMVVIAVAIGYISSRPAATVYIDATAQKVNTLAPATQQLLRSTGNEPVEITAYVNLMDTRYRLGAPDERNTYLRTWEKYTRFKNIKYSFYHYYDTTANNARMFNDYYKDKTLKEVAEEYAETNHVNIDRFKTPEETRKIPGLADEAGRMVLQLKYKGRTTYLRMFDDQEVWPSEAQFSAALKRLMQPSDVPVAGFLTGNLERALEIRGSRNYSTITVNKSTRIALVNNGFDVVTVEDGQEIPGDLSVLVIADPKEALNERTLEKVRHYVDGGGHLLITTEPGKQPVMEPLLKPFGIHIRDGMLVGKLKGEPANVIMALPTIAAANMSQRVASLYSTRDGVYIPGTAVLDYGHDSAAFEVQPLLMNTGDASWLKKGTFVVDSAEVVFSEKDGDEAGSYPVVIGCKRKMNGREQRIIVSGDADFMSNQYIQLQSRTNVSFSIGIFKWLSGGIFPIELSTRAPEDLELDLSNKQVSALKIMVLWVLPGLLLLGGAILLIRRKRK